MKGDSSGGTLVVNWQPRPDWRLRFQYSKLDLDLTLEEGSLDAMALNVAGNSPEHQLAVHSFLDLPRNLSFYAGVRRVDELPNQGVEEYTAVDVNLSWMPREDLRGSIGVRNLNDDRHAEFGLNEIERSAFLEVDWYF